MYIRITNSQPEKYTIGQLRRDNPQISFPNVISDAILEQYGVFPLTATEKPLTDHTKNVAESTPTQVGGAWTQVWNITDASVAEIEVRIREASRSIRAHRDYLLQQSDWIVVLHTEKGLDIPTPWQQYRQALREIPAQTGFPFSITWPTKPE